MNTRTIFRGLLAVFVAVLAHVSFASPVLAQSSVASGDFPSLQASPNDAPQQAASATPAPRMAVLLGYVELAPNVYVRQSNIDQLREFGCTAGPNGTMDGLILAAIQRSRDGRDGMCGEWYNDRVDTHLEESALGWRAMTMPLGLFMRITAKGSNEESNGYCDAVIPWAGATSIAMECGGDPSGQQIASRTLSNIASAGIPMLASTLAGSLTAPTRTVRTTDTTETTLQAALNAGASSGATATNQQPAFNPGNPYGYNPGSDDNQY